MQLAFFFMSDTVIHFNKTLSKSIAVHRWLMLERHPMVKGRERNISHKVKEN